jgi:hypothetical protein
LIDSSAAKQNATEPAVTCLHISPYPDVSIKVSSARAVTVQDVMQGLYDYYTLCLVSGARHFFDGFNKTKGSTEDELILKMGWSL